MEPLTGKELKRKTPDRVTIQAEVVQAIEAVTTQLRDEFKGMIKVNREMVVNCLLSMRSQPLSGKEIEQIRLEKLTKKERAKWLLKQVELAEESGEDVCLESLMKQIQAPKKASKKNLKKSQSPSKQGAFRESDASET